MMKSLAFCGLSFAALIASAAAAHPSTPIDDAAKAAAAAAATADARSAVTPVAAPPAKPMAKHDHHRRPTGDDRALVYDYRDVEQDGVTYDGRWTGTWTGHYEGHPVTVYNGTYDGRHGGSDHHMKRHHDHSDMEHGDRPVYRHHYGYGWGAPMITTITFQSAPFVTTTTTTTEEIVYGAAAPRKRVARRIWKPRPKLRCAC